MAPDKPTYEELEQRVKALEEEAALRKRAEEALRASEEHFRKLVKKSNDILVIIDADGNERYVSESVEAVTGFGPEEYLGNNAFSYLHPDDFEKIQRNFINLVEHPEESIRDEYRHRHKDGSWVHLEAIGTNYIDDPVVGGIVLNVRDITGRKRDEEARIQLVTAIEQAAEVIIITDTEGKILYVNPAFEKITGYSRIEAIGQTPRMLKSGKHDTRFYKELWSTLLQGKVWSGRFTNKRKDGGLIEEEATISPILTSSGENKGYVSVKRDVTDQVKLEAQLRQSRKMEAIGTLAGGIAHDFNNILTIILGYAQILNNKLKDPDLREDIDRLTSAGLRAMDLVGHILTFSRQTEYNRKPMDIKPVIREAMEMLRASLPSTIEIEHTALPPIPQLTADSTEIHQIVMNLCNNAAQAIGRSNGRIGINVYKMELREENPGLDLDVGVYVILEVSDTGPGIASENKDRIFDPYFTTKEAGEGVGLGLSTVHGIANGLGGTVTVYSESGQGAVFKVYFPAIEEEILPEIEMEFPVECGRERILFVDDEKAIVEIAEELLENLGYRVEAHNGSREALNAFRSRPDRYDLVITDYTMPQMTGLDLSKELLTIRPDIPIILCSGFSERIKYEKVKSFGIREVLMKPFLLHQLSKTIRSVLEPPLTNGDNNET